VATRIMLRIESGEKAITSTLTLWLLHILLEETIENYNPEPFLRKLGEIRLLRIVPLKYKHFEEAMSLAQRYGLDLEDAIHLQLPWKTVPSNILKRQRF